MSRQINRMMAFIRATSLVMVVQIPTPSTITFKFDDVIDDIIIAHTQYIGAHTRVRCKFHYKNQELWCTLY